MVHLWLRQIKHLTEGMRLVGKLPELNGLPRWFARKESAYQCREIQVQALGWEDPLEEEITRQYSCLETSTEEPQ